MERLPVLELVVASRNSVWLVTIDLLECEAEHKKYRKVLDIAQCLFLLHDPLYYQFLLYKKIVAILDSQGMRDKQAQCVPFDRHRKSRQRVNYRVCIGSNRKTLTVYRLAQCHCRPPVMYFSVYPTEILCRGLHKGFFKMITTKRTSKTYFYNYDITVMS